MSEGKSEVIQFPKEQPLTPKAKRIIKRVLSKTGNKSDDKEKSDCVLG